MSASASAIIEELRAAFPEKRSGRFAAMVNSSQSDEARLAEESFAYEDDWTRLKPDWLDQAPDGWASALAFLSDEALRFYIPAYLVADLLGSLRRVDPTYRLTDGFEDGQPGKRWRPTSEETSTEQLRARWGALTQAQVNAVVRYLEWRLQLDQSSPEIARALTVYWRPRAAPPEPAE